MSFDLLLKSVLTCSAFFSGILNCDLHDRTHTRMNSASWLWCFLSSFIIQNIPAWSRCEIHIPEIESPHLDPRTSFAKHFYTIQNLIRPPFVIQMPSPYSKARLFRVFKSKHRFRTLPGEEKYKGTCAGTKACEFPADVDSKHRVPHVARLLAYAGF